MHCSKFGHRLGAKGHSRRFVRSGPMSAIASIATELATRQDFEKGHFPPHAAAAKTARTAPKESQTDRLVRDILAPLYRA